MSTDALAVGLRGFDSFRTERSQRPAQVREKRICSHPGCMTVLSRYNEGDLCSVHMGHVDIPGWAEVLADAAGGATLNPVAEVLQDRSPLLAQAEVRRRVKKYRDRIVAGYRGGLSQGELAEKFDLCRSTVEGVLHRAGLKFDRKRGIPEEIKAEVLRLFCDTDLTVREIAESVGLAYSQAERIIARTREAGVALPKRKPGRPKGRRDAGAL